jgi:hypothetical protein
MSSSPPVALLASHSLRLRVRLSGGLSNWCVPGTDDAAALDLRLCPAAEVAGTELAGVHLAGADLAGTDLAGTDSAGAQGIPLPLVAVEAHDISSGRGTEAHSAAKTIPGPAPVHAASNAAGTPCCADSSSRAERAPSPSGTSDGAAPGSAFPATPVTCFPDCLACPSLGPLRAGGYYAWATFFHGQHVRGSPTCPHAGASPPRQCARASRSELYELPPSGIVAQATPACRASCRSSPSPGLDYDSDGSSRPLPMLPHPPTRRRDALPPHRPPATSPVALAPPASRLVAVDRPPLTARASKGGLLQKSLASSLPRRRDDVSPCRLVARHPRAARRARSRAPDKRELMDVLLLCIVPSGTCSNDFTTSSQPSPLIRRGSRIKIENKTAHNNRTTEQLGRHTAAITAATASRPSGNDSSWPWPGSWQPACSR